MGEFETVMQTRDAVGGLHNFREFSQPPNLPTPAPPPPPPLRALILGYLNTKKGLYYFYEIFSRGAQRAGLYNSVYILNIRIDQ